MAFREEREKVLAKRKALIKRLRHEELEPELRRSDQVWEDCIYTQDNAIKKLELQLETYIAEELPIF